MAKTSPQTKNARTAADKKDTKRQFESEALSLQSLRLIAAPDPKDDLSDEELADVVKGKKGYSAALVQHLIEHIKSI